MNTGEVYGKYRLVERIASGGMAEVFKAIAVGAAGFEKPVAIKRLHRRMSEDADLVGMLQDEARLCSKLNHGNICQVLDLGHVQDTYYIAMEYVNGRDLFSVLRKASQSGRPLPLPASLLLTCEMLAGLDYAHRKRDAEGQLLHIIHRDISPQNVLITWDGEVKIIDFGIAKARTSTHKTQAGIIKGKFRYMSPEQARGEPIDHRTDIFATGVVLYEMITGRPHAAGATDREILIKIQTGKFDRLRDLVPDLPADLEEMVHRALDVNPDHRWSSARAFRKALLTFMRTNRLSYSRDDLAEYIRYLFKEDTGQDTSLEASCVPPAVAADPEPAGFASGGGDPFSVRARIELPDPAPAEPPAEPPAAAPAATVNLQAEAAELPEPTPPPQRKRQRKASRVKPTVALDRQPTPAPTARRTAPPGLSRPPEGTAQIAVPAHPAAATTPHPAPRGGGSSLAVLLRWLVLLAVLGAAAVGAYLIYVLYIQQTTLLGTAASRLGRASGKGRAPTARMGSVSATLEIDSRPRGARIVLAGKDTTVKTPGRFPDLTVPTRLAVELRHPRFKTRWKRTIPVASGDVVRFTADLRSPPQLDADDAGSGAQAPRGGRKRRGGFRGGARPRTSASPGARAAAVESDVAHLIVTSNQLGAEVVINGKVRGRIQGKQGFNKRVRPATFSIQVRSASERSDVRVVTLAPGQVKRLHFQLGP